MGNDKLAEVMAKLQKTEEKDQKPEETAIKEVEEEKPEEEEEEEDSEEEDSEEEDKEEAEVPVKPIPKQSEEEKLSQDEIIAGEVNLLQNTGVFRREVMMALHDIATSLQKLSSIVPEDK